MSDEEKRAKDYSVVKEFREKNVNIVFIIERSLNKNVVVYEAKVTDGKLKKDDPIEVYWMDIDPEYVKANRKKGVESDRSELNFVEKKMAYGVSAEALGDDVYKLILVALSKKNVKLYMKDGKPVAETDIDGHDKCHMIRVFVHSVSSWTGPKVKWVEIYGIDLNDGSVVVERIIP